MPISRLIFLHFFQQLSLAVDGPQPQPQASSKGPVIKDSVAKPAPLLVTVTPAAATAAAELNTSSSFVPAHRKPEGPPRITGFALRDDPVLPVGLMGELDPIALERPILVGGIFNTAMRESDRRRLRGIRSRFMALYKDREGQDKQCWVDPKDTALLKILDAPGPAGEMQQRALSLLQDLLNGHHLSLASALKCSDKEITRILLHSGCSFDFNKEYQLLSEDTKAFIAGSTAVNMICFHQFLQQLEVTPNAASLRWSTVVPFDLLLEPSSFTPNTQKRDVETPANGGGKWRQNGGPMRREGPNVPYAPAAQNQNSGTQQFYSQVNSNADQRGRSRSSMRVHYNGPNPQPRTRFQSRGPVSTDPNPANGAPPPANPMRPSANFTGQRPKKHYKQWN